MLRRNFLRSLIGTAAGLWGVEWAAIPPASSAETAVASGPPKFQVNTKEIRVKLSAAGEIVAVKAGGRRIGVVGRTSLASPSK